jgi:hypothetical protein
MLICEADGNPDDYKYEWDFRSANETEAERVFDTEIRNKKSYLKLGDVPQKRTYICRANNTVGPGTYCEITVEGKYCMKRRRSFVTAFRSKISIGAGEAFTGRKIGILIKTERRFKGFPLRL